MGFHKLRMIQSALYLYIIISNIKISKALDRSKNIVSVFHYSFTVNFLQSQFIVTFLVQLSSSHANAYMGIIFNENQNWRKKRIVNIKNIIIIDVYAHYKYLVCAV